MCFVTLGHDASSSTVTLSNQATDFNPLSIAFNLHRYCEQEQQQCQQQPQCQKEITTSTKTVNTTLLKSTYFGWCHLI